MRYAVFLFLANILFGFKRGINILVRETNDHKWSFNKIAEYRMLKTKEMLPFPKSMISIILMVAGKLLLPLIVLLVFSSHLFSQKANIKFDRITINDGLSLSSVYCIFQDSKGFMWFGTEDGLNKYDGHNFSVYRPDPFNANSLSYRWTEHIFEDSYGIIWLGSKGGLSAFDPEREIFQQFRHLDGEEMSLSSDTITAIIEDNNGNIWVGTMYGLNCIQSVQGFVERVSLLNTKKGKQLTRINDLALDDDGVLWIASDEGLFQINHRNNTPDRICFGDGKSSERVFSVVIDSEVVWAGTDFGLLKYGRISDEVAVFPLPDIVEELRASTVIEKIVVDQYHNLWVGTPLGLFFFDPYSTTFLQMVEAVDFTQSLAVNTAKPFLNDSREYIWYGTFGAGLYKINTLTLEVDNYLNNTSDPFSLSQNSINCLYEDRTGVIWIGTFGAGINTYDRQAHKFELFTHDPQDANSLSSNFVWTVFEEDDGSIWVGTNREGLNRYSPETGLFTRFTHDESDPGSISASSIRKVYQDTEGTIWVGTDGGGLNRFDSQTETFTHFKSDPDDPTTISGNSVRVIYEDDSGKFWVGTRSGLNMFDRATGRCKRFLHLPDDDGSISHDFIYSAIHQDWKGRLWIGTYGGGLNKMDIESETFTSYLNDPASPASISDNIVFSIFEAENGMLWIGTNNGLNRFDPEREEFIRFGTVQGLPNEVIYGILPDEDFNIWFSTNQGISKFSLLDFGIENFDVSDGLQSNEFNGGAFHKGNSGKFYFGGVYGLNIVKPENIGSELNQSAVVFTRFDILGKEVGVNPGPVSDETEKSFFDVVDENGQLFMNKAIAYTDKIRLDYKNRFLGFEFTALNTPPSENVTYSYKMENVDEVWNFSGDRNYVTYANMSPGTYTFMVNAMNEDGSLSLSPALLKIIIDPPIWRTWWFYLMEIFAAGLLAAFIYVYLLNKRTNKLLTLQNQEIQATNQKLRVSEKKLKELVATKDKFFSIIAHDLKNPFTSLLSISELLSTNYNTLDEEDKIEGIQGFHSSARRIYSLLENLLLWSRAQTGRIKFNPMEFDIVQVAVENIDLISLQAEKKEISIAMISGELYMVHADREMINTVLQNLLHNSIKYSNPGGKVNLEISEQEGLVKVAVTDTGIGITEDRMQKLFDAASKTVSDGTAGEKGTGLGLIVCKEFIERHGSRLLAYSKPGLGSEFNFYLQKAKD